MATAAGAVSGIGGGVIIKPFMDALSGLDVASVNFLSNCTVLAMSTVALLRGLRQTQPAAGPAAERDTGESISFNTKIAMLLAIGAAVGGLAGKAVFDLIKKAFPEDRITGAVQSTLILLLTAGVFLFSLKKEHIRPLAVTHPAATAGLGMLLGLLSAFLGIGGGPINIAVLSFFFGMNTKTCVIYSLYIIFFSQVASLAGTLITRSWPPVDPLILFFMVVGGVAGGFFGSKLARRVEPKQVDVLFRIMMLIIIGISAYNGIRFLFQQ